MTDVADGTRFDELVAAHRARLGSAPAERTADLAWAGLPVRVCIRGASLARLFRRPVAHLLLAPPEANDRAAISIHLAESEDVRAASLLQQLDGDLPRAWTAPNLQVRSSECGRILSFAFDQRSHFVVDRKSGIVVGVQDPAHLVLFERTKPLLLPLRLLLHDLGVQVVHAGLVAHEGQGILIAGPERVGKSSAALRCFLAGFDLLGDDQAALVPAGEGILGHSLYSAVQIESEWLTELGHFPASAVDRDVGEDKVGVFLAEVAPRRLRRSVPIRAILLPRLAPGQPTKIVRAAKAEALRRIAPSTLFQPLGGGEETARFLQLLVQRIPAYWLDAGEDGLAIPAAVRQLVA